MSSCKNMMLKIEFFAKKLHIPLDEVIETMGISRSAYFHFKRYPEKLRIETVMKVSKLLGVDIDILILDKNSIC